MSHISQLVSTPPGLRALFLVAFRDGDKVSSTIVDRTVDAVALLELNSADLRGNPREKVGADRGRKTKVVGLIMEGMLEPKPAPLATDWFQRLYGDRLIGAEFLGYTRSDTTLDEIMEAVSAGNPTPEMDATRRYWMRAARSALERLTKGQ